MEATISRLALIIDSARITIVLVISVAAATTGIGFVS
jgi:hypothetical protein